MSARILAILLLILPIFAQAKKDPACPTEFAEIAERPKFKLKRAIEAFKEKAGFEPDIWSPTKSLMNVDKPGGGQIGKIVFFIHKKKTLEIDEIRINKDYRGMGLSEILLGKILKENDGIERILSTDLVDDNGAALKEAIAKGSSCPEAMMATAAYRMRARLGFSKFDGEPNCKTGEFAVVRP